MKFPGTSNFTGERFRMLGFRVLSLTNV